MGIISGNQRPQSLKCAAEAIKNGYVYKDDGSGRMTITTAVADVAVAIALDSSLDPQTASAKTMTAGEKMPFALMGSGATVEVAAANAAVFQENGAVYTCQDADTNGTCSNASSCSAVKIGHYAGVDAYTVSTDATLVPVRLDVFPTA